MQSSIEPQIEAEAARIVAAGAREQVALRLLGGLAIRLHSPSAAQPPFARAYPDIDLASDGAKSHAIEQLFARLGYAADREFNMLNGSTRLLFWDARHQRQVDVFVGQFVMCHQVPFANRLALDTQTLPLAELLLTKLQVVQLNPKDLSDICVLLLDHPVGEADGETINRRRIAELCGKDWGLWKTVMLNLDAATSFCQTLAVPADARERIVQRIAELRTAINDVPKTLAWKARAAVGERVRWYSLPEEVQRG